MSLSPTDEEVSALMAEAESLIGGTEDGAIVALCEKVLKLLAAIGLVFFNVAINPMLVGVHVDSRDGLGPR